MKCSRKQTEMIHGIMIAFHQLYHLCTAMGRGQTYLQLVKNTPWNNPELARSWRAELDMAGLGVGRPGPSQWVQADPAQGWHAGWGVSWASFPRWRRRRLATRRAPTLLDCQ